MANTPWRALFSGTSGLAANTLASGVGLQATKPSDLDGALEEMIKVKRPVLFDCRVAALENCFPMIPSGKAHNEMLLPEEATDEATAKAFAGGKALV